jgi:hypothetical protein
VSRDVLVSHVGKPEGALVVLKRFVLRMRCAGWASLGCVDSTWRLQCQRNWGKAHTVAQLVSYFTDQGYKLYRYENKQLIETPVEKVVEDNWVFVHPSRMDRFRSILAPSA